MDGIKCNEVTCISKGATTTLRKEDDVNNKKMFYTRLFKGLNVFRGQAWWHGSQDGVDSLWVGRMLNLFVLEIP